ncbi:MAG TPA: serine hydrolase domain-containing protein [Steroidobacteraceae bacterium]|jgi:CubicO group peptidase (beta-lactamase class C family)|nr:serine hydrolase domain-containing protein [Steroidobacteraceae bacterium]
MRVPRSLFAAAILLPSFHAAAPAQSSLADLDSVARRAVAQSHVVGASVLVAKGDRILLLKGYGVSDLGLEAPSKPDSVYHIVGPMLPFIGVAVMQQVERGKLSLDDDISKYLPEFPTQGHRVTVRHLISNTSGIVDYHYRGDPLESTYRQPKAMDEVIALFANGQWIHEPGTQWDWSVSNFQLLTEILERVSGQSLAEYMHQNLFGPAGAGATTPCDNSSVIHGLSHSYQSVGDHYEAATEDSSAVSYDLRFCSTVSDLFQLWRAVQRGKLLKPGTLKLMITAAGPGIKMTAGDPNQHYGMAFLLGHEDDHRDVGQNGSLLGYSGSMYQFPADDLTVIVLTNTSGQNAKFIGSALARKVLALPPDPAPPAAAQQPILTDEPVSADERSKLTGTYVLKVVEGGYHDSFAQYRRTYRVFDENGRLMIEALGEKPERLLKQNSGNFAIRSWPQAPVTFVMHGQNAFTLHLTHGGLRLAGERVGPADPQTFHTYGTVSPKVSTAAIAAAPRP